MGKICGMTTLIAWLFYDSVWGLCCICIVLPFLLREYQLQKKREYAYQLEKEFQAGLIFATGALEAGYSVENAWKETEREVTRLYGKASVFAPRLHEINQQVEMNEPLERLLMNWGQQESSENIRNFAEVFFFARRTGGNISTIMRRTSNRIAQNFQILEEIQLQLTSKRLELLIMSIMPFGILGYLRLSSDSFLAPLYHSVFGVSVMTACLGIYFVAMYLAKRLIQIGG